MILKRNKKRTLKIVPTTGLEPAQLLPLPPQGSVSTNSTTSAGKRYYTQIIASMEYLAQVFVIVQAFVERERVLVQRLAREVVEQRQEAQPVDFLGICQAA